MNRKKTILDVLYRKQVFLEYESIGLKKTPNLHFSKGFSPWFWSKSWSFIIFSVYQKQIEKKCLVTFWIKKKTLKTIRTCVYEERKINFFPKGKSIVFVKNLRFIQRSFSFKIDQEKLSGDVLVRKTFFCHPL